MHTDKLWENYLKNKLGNAGVTKWTNRGYTGKMPVMSNEHYLISLIWSWGKEYWCFMKILVIKYCTYYIAIPVGGTYYTQLLIHNIST